MKSREHLNKLYAAKCEQLGDLILNREKIDTRIKDLKSEIEVLNSSLPIMESLESIIRAHERIESKSELPNEQE